MQALHEMGLMQPKVKRALAEDVLPWLIGKTQNFLNEDMEAIYLSEDIINEGIMTQSNLHAATLRKMAQWRIDQAQAKKDAEIAKIKRRAERKLAREKRANDAKKAAMKKEIETNIIDKGECLSGVISQPLLDMHGCYG